MARAFIRTVPNQHRAVCSDDPGLQALSYTHDRPLLRSTGAALVGFGDVGYRYRYGTGMLIPRHFLFDLGFTCTVAKLNYASGGISSHSLRAYLFQERLQHQTFPPALGLTKLGGVECRFVMTRISMRYRKDHTY